MGLDPFSPISPARINVLLLPAGRIKSARFQYFVARLQKECIVSLRDLNLDFQEDRHRFDPSAFPDGRVLFDFSSSDHDRQSVDAFPFELNSSFQVLLVLADGTELESPANSDLLDDESPQFKRLLAEFEGNRKRHSKRLAYQLIVFEKTASTPIGDDILFVSSLDETDNVGLRKVVHHLTRTLLSRFSELAEQLHGESIGSPRVLSLSRRQSERGPGRMSSRKDLTASAVIPARSESPMSRLNGAASSIRSLSAAVSQVAGASNGVQANRSKARYQIVLGGLYLQAGQWSAALQEISEGALAARNNTADYLWHARALELLLVCMILLGWAGVPFDVPVVCYPTTNQLFKIQSTTAGSASNVSDTNASSKERLAGSLHNLAQVIPGTLRSILTLYSRAADFTQEKLPPIMHSETKVRLANVLLILQLGGGDLSARSLDVLVQNPDQLSQESKVVFAERSGLRRNEIASMLVEAATESQSELSSNDFVHALVGITSRLSMLDLERKQGFYLKELLQNLIPGLVEARKIGAAEMGIHPAAGLAMPGGNAHRSLSALHKGVRSLLEMTAKIYGLPPMPTSADIDNSSTEVTVIGQHLHEWIFSQHFGDSTLKLEILRICSGVCEALPDLPGGLHFTSELLRTAKRSVTMSERSPNSPPSIPPEEQSRLIGSINRTVTAASKLGMPTMRANYWDDFLVRDVQIFDAQNSRKLNSHTTRDLMFAVGDSADTRKDPFIYNPFSKSKAASEKSPVLVAGEEASFVVTLQNPFEFDVDIDHISLVTEGCDFAASSHSAALSPFCCQNFVISGIPKSPGNLKVTGCLIKVRNCLERRFFIFDKVVLPPAVVKLKPGASRSKVIPLQETSKASKDRYKGPTPEELSLLVVGSQPVVSVVDTTLTQPSIMLLEGETKSFQLTLQNESNSIPADLVWFSFEDSVTKQLQTAVENRDLNPAELYELHNQLATKPCIRLVTDFPQDQERHLDAGASRTFIFEVFGKPGLLNAVVLVDYAHLGSPYLEVKETFYTRQTRFELLITVNGSVDIPRINILPLSQNFPWKGELESHPKNGEGTRESTQTAKDSNGYAPSTFTDLQLHSESDGFCMVLLDLRNVWPQPISIQINTPRNPPQSDTSTETKGAVISHTETLQPGYISRIMLVVPRIFVQEPYKPIPLLGNQRQFVVSASKMTIEAEAASREAFWYREELLKSVQGTWKDESTGRKGEIDFRKGIRLSARAIEALRVDHVGIEFSVKTERQQQIEDVEKMIQQTGKSRFVLPTETFATLVVRVQNRTKDRVRLLLRMQPSLGHQPHNVALDLSKRFVWSGVLQRALHPELEPGAVREVEMGITALCEGEFEIGATVEEIKGRRAAMAQGGTDMVGISTERRIWHAQEPCLIDAVERRNN